MPSPVAHGLAGVILYAIPRSSHAPTPNWPGLALAAFAGAAADVDFLPGLLVGDPSHFHHGVSHSLGAALAFGFLMAFLAPGTFSESYLRRALAFSGLYGSHLVLDFFTVDRSFPSGEPLFWPLSSQVLISPWTLFLDVKHGPSWEAFVNWTNVRAVALEAALLLPSSLGLLWMRGYFRASRAAPPPREVIARSAR